jgi:type IV secretory pathway TrbD component
MPDKTQQKHRTNRVFKSLHKPLTYLGVERTLFYFVCVGAVGAFNLFNSILAGIAVFIGGFAFGHWVTNSDPAFLRILAKSERYKRALRRRQAASPPCGGGVMLRLDKVIKPWKESAALNDHINLYGFWNETAFLTKSGDLGMVLSVPGVDYESLDRSEQEYAVKRLEAALKAFGPGFHVYQYLFKSNRPDIPFARYDDPIVEAAIDQRRKFFEAKRDHLYQVEIFYCILLEGARSKTGVGTALARLLRDPEGAIAELKSQFTERTS